MSLTVREVMQKLSKEHPDAPVNTTIERLYYRMGVIRPEETEIEHPPVESVTRSLDGSVVIG
jgi:hypothetical protein